MRFWRIWLLASLAAVCILAGCSKQEPGVEIGTPVAKNSPDEISEDVQITQWNLNTVDFELWAARVLRWEKSHLTLADSVFIKSYNPDGSLKSTLVADSARVDEVNNLIIGKGHVQVDSDNGVMKADYARWDRNTDEMQAKGNVILIRGDNTLYGKELQTDIRLDRIEIVDVSAKGTVNEEDFTW